MPSFGVFSDYPGLHRTEALTTDPGHYGLRSIDGAQIRIRHQHNLPPVFNVPKGLAADVSHQSPDLNPYDGTSAQSLLANLCVELFNDSDSEAQRPLQSHAFVPSRDLQASSHVAAKISSVINTSSSESSTAARISWAARMQNKPGYANLTPKGRRDTLKHRDGRSQAKILDVETTDAQISSAKR